MKTCGVIYTMRQIIPDLVLKNSLNVCFFQPIIDKPSKKTINKGIWSISVDEEPI